MSALRTFDKICGIYYHLRMKDNLGNELKEGDTVGFIKKNRDIEVTKVEGFTSERVRVKRTIYQVSGEVKKITAVESINLIKLQ